MSVHWMKPARKFKPSSNSLYTARAIDYRNKNDFPHEKVLISVGVQKMVNSKALEMMACEIQNGNAELQFSVRDTGIGILKDRPVPQWICIYSRSIIDLYPSLSSFPVSSGISPLKLTKNHAHRL